ncbi:hypothetical protein [Halorussus salinisoli]|uniref:hypothetical protein n=1 Tax=Halorussus salinisoli TaxID=2558242 RepID=UPI0010C21980|nr:hypothetical protein [Halorussus salinisoli]
MATKATSRLRQAVKLAVVLLVVAPVLVQWGFVGADFASAADLVPSVDAALLVRLGGLAVLSVVVALLVGQKRRSRGQRSSADAPEEAEDRRVEGSGETYAPYAYNNQQKARREGERIRERAEDIVDADRRR